MPLFNLQEHVEEGDELTQPKFSWDLRRVPPFKKTEQQDEEALEALEGRSVGKLRDEGSRDRAVAAMKRKKKKSVFSESF